MWWAAIPAAIGLAGSIYGATKKAAGPGDVDLAKENPELWKELQELKGLIGEYDRLYRERSKGATAGEISQIAQARSSMADRMGSLGLTGSSAGAQMVGGAEAEMQNALQARIANERQAMVQQLMQMRHGYSNALQSGIMPQLESMRAEDQARNQFFSGLMNSGLSAMGTSQYLDTMKSMPSGPTYYGTVPSTVNMLQTPTFGQSSPYYMIPPGRGFP